MKTAISFFLILIVLQIQAQEKLLFCGTDEMRQQLFQQHPEIHSGIQYAYSRLDTFTAQYIAQQASTQSRGGQVYIIPVVFHVIHNYGEENISDEQIYNAIEVLNRNYRKQNADTVDIVADFKPIAADCEIELRLARKDPNGNCTKGINRIASPLTYIGDHQVKSLIQWPTDKYLNVYVCADAAEIAGHALLPADADTVPDWDGIVIRHDYLGNIGTSNQLRSVVLSHEVGHYLNLQHIWGGNNVPGFFYLPVGQQNNCNFDDGVNDTPNTIGWSVCNLNAASCGSARDNVQNFMDYAYCARMFTQGQKLRMHACLNSPIAGRINLWQQNNLIATGTDGSITLCEADFEATATTVCEGQSVTFIDKSYHKVTGRNWSFEGGDISTSNDSIVTVTYNTAGNYDVTITATDGNNNNTTTKQNIITVLPNGVSNAPYYESFETYSSLPNSNWFTNDLYQDGSFQLNINTAYTGSNSIFINNFNAGKGSIDELLSNSYSLQAPATTNIVFKYAFAFKTGTATNDRLRVFISNDCGQTWAQRKNISGNTLSTAAATNQPFVPQSISEWKTTTIGNVNSSFFNDRFRIKFLFESDGGNNLYIDDINIANAVFTSINNQEASAVNIYPNPVTELLQVDANEQIIEGITWYDIAGKEIQQQNINNTSVTLNTYTFKRGVYLLQLELVNGFKTIQKVIKQ